MCIQLIRNVPLFIHRGNKHDLPPKPRTWCLLVDTEQWIVHIYSVIEFEYTKFAILTAAWLRHIAHGVYELYAIKIRSSGYCNFRMTLCACRSRDTIIIRSPINLQAKFNQDRFYFHHNYHNKETTYSESHPCPVEEIYHSRCQKNCATSKEPYRRTFFWLLLHENL